MATLAELRVQIDAVDDELVRLFEERVRLGGQVGDYKIQNGMKIFDRQREREKLKDVAEKASTEFNKKGVQELFEQLMAALYRSKGVGYPECKSGISWDRRGLQPGSDGVLFR